MKTVLLCYEAGYDGFWLARSLKTEKIDCRVLDPVSLQVNRRARRVKTDRLDVLMLLRALIAADRGTGMSAPLFVFRPSRKKTHAARIANANG